MRRRKFRVIGWCWAESARHTILGPGCLRRGPSTEQPTAEGLLPKPFLELELGWLEGFSESILGTPSCAPRGTMSPVPTMS